jgi:hypothetical protein
MAKQEFDHKGFMTDPNKWPMWPLLPVKQRVGMQQPKLGIMRDEGDISMKFGLVPPKVWLTNLYEIQMANRKWEEIEVLEYMDFEGLLDAGWVVD